MVGGDGPLWSRLATKQKLNTVELPRVGGMPRLIKSQVSVYREACEMKIVGSRAVIIKKHGWASMGGGIERRKIQQPYIFIAWGWYGKLFDNTPFTSLYHVSSLRQQNFRGNPRFLLFASLLFPFVKLRKFPVFVLYLHH